MTEVEEEIEQLEHQKEINKELIHKGNLLNKLEQYPEFKEIILDDFCLKDCARYLQVSVNTLVAPEARENSLNMAKASGYLLSYLDTIKAKALTASQQQLNIDRELDSLR